MKNEYVLGIDVGGQTSKLGVVSSQGEVIAQSVIRSDTYGSDSAAFINALAAAVKDVVAQAGVEIKGIGVGAPNGNYYTGCIKSAPNLEWARTNEVHLAEDLSKALGGIPVTLTNDANAAAMGEMAYGVTKGMKNFIMITLGTGVGSGIVIDGKMVYGHDGFAGELGHTIAIDGGRPCGCGRKGCLEAYCSATGVARTALERLAQSDEPSLLRSVEKISSKDVYDAAKKGDKIALEIFDYTGYILGKAMANFVAFSAPEAIVLFGGLARSKEFLDEPIKRGLNENVLGLWRDKIKVLYSALKESDAAILGASALAW
ncbi:MAG: ROK family protein [Bacteroidales bacterium]|nr:ROK family protein [Bacteroidales bacterium]